MSVDEPVDAFGLKFLNPLGIAAGIDRTGADLAKLAATGVGHVEVGTLTTIEALGADRSALPEDFKIGINFASARIGIDSGVIEDFVRGLQATWKVGDYFVANLSSPFSGRTGDTPGVGRLIERLAQAHLILSRSDSTAKPLLVKVHAGPAGTLLPRALICARALGLKGVVLVTSDTVRIGECWSELDDTEIVSVGGIATAQDMFERVSAGARLVQTYSSYVRDGARAVHRILGRAGQERRC